MDPEHRTIIFVTAVLYSMEEKWRGLGFSQSFGDILKNRHDVNLHMAWLKLKEEGLLDEFSDQFWFCKSRGTSVLWEMVNRAFFSHYLIRMDGDGEYHLDEVTPRTVELLLRQVEISTESVQQVATRLNELLNEQAIKVGESSAL